MNVIESNLGLEPQTLYWIKWVLWEGTRLQRGARVEDIWCDAAVGLLSKINFQSILEIKFLN